MKKTFLPGAPLGRLAPARLALPTPRKNFCVLALVLAFGLLAQPLRAQEGSPASLPEESPPPCIVTVPLPSDLTVTPAGQDVPPEMAAFAGAWQGTWQRAGRPVTGPAALFIVETIDTSQATIVYSLASDHSVLRRPSQLAPGGVLQWRSSDAPDARRYAFTMAADLSSITGAYESRAATFQTTMTRCTPESTTPIPTTPAAEGCEPTDQDTYVYAPRRLYVLSPCVRATGLVRRSYAVQEDGDGIIDLELDDAFASYLYPGNVSGMESVGPMGGALHLEVVCYSDPLEKNPAKLCSQNPSPVREPLPGVGQRIEAEGRWVLDMEHGNWAELHPVYRWRVIE